MKIELKRRWYTAQSTIGEIFIDGVRECFSLERPDDGNKPGVSCIDEGEYELEIRPSFHLKVPNRAAADVKRDAQGNILVIGVKNVPGRDNIESHPANYPSQLHGCIAPGVVRGQDAVWSSDVAFEAFFDKVQAAIEAGETVTITITKEVAA